MVRWARVCLQATLKLVNSVIGLVGMGLILYSLWLIRVWYKNSLQYSGSPWFMYTILGLGVSFCLITCSGHVAAETASGHCLSCYMVFVFFIVMLEAGIITIISLNRNWEEDFPYDPSGRFNELKDFVRSNFEMCKWLGMLFAAAQMDVIKRTRACCIMAYVYCLGKGGSTLIFLLFPVLCLLLGLLYYL